MKQETGKKKSKLWLWLVIGLVALLAVAGVVLALVLGSGGETGPKGGRPELYWNVDRKAYTENSESGLSTREPGEDGTFKVRFAIGGELVEYTVADKQLINFIDTLDAMGLVKDSHGTVVDVIDPKDIAKEVNKNAYVKSTTADKIIANTSVAMNGMNINVKLEEGLTEIYDVTPEAEVPGQKITIADLRPMDTLVVYANDLDQVTHIYVNSHSKQSKVYWRADQSYSSTEKSTTRVPDENGAYTIPFFCEGEVVELKTKDKAIATKIDSISRWKCHFGFTFDEEGYIIEQFASAIGIQGVAVADCWDIVDIQGDTYTIQRLTTNDGSVWTGTIPAGIPMYEAGVKAKREGQGGRKIDSLQMGDRVTVWTDTNGEVILVYVAERLVDSPAYWNVSRKYDSTKKETKREIGPSGYYEVELLKGGSNRKEIYYVKDKETMSYIDSITAKIVGLKVLPGNIVEYAYNEETLTGYTTATRGGVVTAVTGSIFTKMTYGKRGTESNMVLAPNAKIYNASQYGQLGAETTVQPGDHIYAVRQPTGEILIGFITKRTIGGEKLYWNLELMWDKTNKVSTREPDADGWYHFTMAHRGKQVELKTKNKEIVEKIDKLSIGACALDVSGGVIYNVYDAAYPYGGNKVASGYKFQYVTSEGKYFCTYASDANKTVEFAMADDCVIYNVSPVFDKFKGERIYSIPKNSMLTVFCDIYGEAKVVYVRSKAVKDMYWKTEKLYDSTNKVTKRVPDADGYYWFNLAVNGECKPFKTKDQKIANSMDSYDGAFGLNVREDEIFGFVSTSGVENVSGNGFTTATVTAINGRTITVETSKGTEKMKLASNAKIYDVSPVAENFGAVATIQVGDVIRTYLNSAKTEHNYVYIKNHQAKTMYWKTEKLYDSTNKVTKRVPDADGYYWFNLAVNGECKPFKTKDQKIANSMDSYDGAFGLNVREDEIFGFVSTSGVENVSGNGFTTATVTAINGNELTVEASDKTEKMKLTSDCKIYDVSPIAEKFGAVSTLKVGDIIRTYLNKDKSAHSYVYIKSRPARVNGEIGYCEVCEKEVKWTPMSNSSAITQADGHWYVPADMTQWVQSTFASASKDYTICLDLNGKVLTRAEDGRNFRVAEGETLNIMDSVGGGKIVTHGGTGYNGGLMMVSSGATVNMYGGTLEYVDTGIHNGQGGNIYMSGAETVFNLYDGVITGGVTTAHNKDKLAYGGNFYLTSGATLNMYAGEISNGVARGILLATADPDGKVTHTALAPYGGNIYMTESSNVNIFGGVVKDGKAIRETFTYIDESGAEKTVSNMSYGGNIYKVNTQKLDGCLYIENATISGGEAHRGGNINAYAGSGATPKIDDPNYDPEGPEQGGIVVLNNATITGGKASQFGGNIMSNCASWMVVDSKITDGVITGTTGNGGNIYSQGGIYNVTGTVISGGKAPSSGGNINLYKNKYDANVFVIGEGTVIENGEAPTGGNINVQSKNYVKLADGKVVAPADDDGTGEAMLPTLGILGGEIKGGNAATGADIYTAGHTYIEGGVVAGDIHFEGKKEAQLEIAGGEVGGVFMVKNPLDFALTGAPAVANLTFDKNVKAAVGELTEGASIKVTTHHESPIFTYGFDNATAYVEAGYITGCEEGSSVTVTADNELKLEAAPPAAELRYCEHCKQMVEFTEWTYGSGSYTRESGHFYLTKNGAIASNHRIGNSSSDKAADGVDVVIDLNGFNITSTGPVFYVYPYSTLTLQDSVGTSVVTGAGTLRNSAPADGGVFYVEGKNANLNIYAGTYTLADTDKVRNGGVIFGGGTIKIFGGTFNGNTVSGAGSAFNCSGNLQINGGTINGEVYSRGTTTLNGAPVIELLQIPEGVLVTLGELTDGTDITVDAIGAFTKTSSNAQAYLDAGYFKPANAEWTIENRSGALFVNDGNAPFDPNAVYEQAKAMDFSGADADGKVTAVCPVCREEVEWLPLEANQTGAGITLAAGHYYLSANIDYTANNYHYSFTAQDTLCLNLNGQNLTNIDHTSNISKGRVFYTEKAGTVLNIMGEGTVTGNGYFNGEKPTGAFDLTTDANFYGGTYITTGTGPAIGNRKTSSGEATVSIYAGTVVKNENGPAVAVYKNGRLNICGGNLQGNVQENNSKGITVSGAPVIDSLDLSNGAKITVGDLITGANITVVADGVFTEEFDNAKAYLNAGYFVSGVEGAEVKVEGKTLTIGADLDPDAVYNQAKAMDFSAGGTVTALCPACGTEQNWVELPAPTSSSKSQLAAGHYYVADNMEVTKFWYIAANTNGVVCVNLNGKSITNTAERVFYAENAANVLNIMGEGTVTSGGGYNSANTNYYGVLDLCTTANLYGGTYTSTNEYPVVVNRGSGAHSVLNIYGGTKIVRTAEDAKGLNLFIADNATVNMYGGLISGGTAIGGDDNTKHPALGVGKSGGNVLLKVNLKADKNYDYDCSFNLYGGTVENGVAENLGGNIAAIGNDIEKPSAAVNICGGTVANGSVCAHGGNAVVNISGNPTVDYLEMAASNLVNVADMTEGASVKVSAGLGAPFTTTIGAKAADYAQYFYGAGNHTKAIVKDDALVLEDVCPHCNVPLSEITWTEVVHDGAKYIFPASGHYKMTSDLESTGNTFTFNDAATAAAGLDVVVDTCGFDISSKGRVAYVAKNNKFTIFDSVGGTVATSISTNNALGGSGMTVYSGAEANIYDITINGSAGANGKGNCISVYSTTAVVNIYSGTFNGTDCTTSGNNGGTVYNHGTLNIYGGTFSDAELTDALGGCLYSDGTLNIADAELKGDVHIAAGATTVSGATKIADLQIANGVKIALGELTDGADITVTADGAFAEGANAQAYVNAGYIKAPEGKQISAEGNTLSMAAVTLLKMLAGFLGL